LYAVREQRVFVKALVTFALVMVCAGCGRSSSNAETAGRAAAATREVSLPDLSRLAAAVQAQVRERYGALTATLARRGSSESERAAAYGSLAMVLDAAEYHDAAEPAYLNAQALDPDDAKWPYYLAHLYRSEGNTDQALAAFTRVLELHPDDAAALIWMGRMHLDEGDAEGAEHLFDRARAVAPRTVAVLAGLGQAALARKDYARAATLLEEALALDSSSASIHSPLATAYRGLGDTARAEAHIKQWRNTEILVPDPRRQELDLTLESGLSYELRGVRALESRNFTAAAGFFRRGAALEPGTTGLGRSLRHKLGTALYLSGDLPGAMEQFREVVGLSPAEPPDETASRAHYSLGVLMATAGREREAIEHLAAAVRYGPNYVEALQALGDALRRGGRTHESLAPYKQALSVNPQSADARFGYAMALVRLDRHREALDVFSEGARLHPDRPAFAEGMARLLAASPDDTVRDGPRAMAIVDRLLAGEKTIQLAETTAMALAEVGNYREAAAVLRQVVEAAARDRLSFDTARTMRTLRLYERGQPCREPWPDDDPAHNPGPTVTPQAGTMLSRAPAEPR
jgi:tetratricopeptide (TPR) repeat protein